MDLGVNGAAASSLTYIDQSRMVVILQCNPKMMQRSPAEESSLRIWEQGAIPGYTVPVGVDFVPYAVRAPFQAVQLYFF